MRRRCLWKSIEYSTVANRWKEGYLILITDCGKYAVIESIDGILEKTLIENIKISDILVGKEGNA